MTAINAIATSALIRRSHRRGPAKLNATSDVVAATTNTLFRLLISAD
jgi:hypothetical protein